MTRRTSILFWVAWSALLLFSGVSLARREFGDWLSPLAGGLALLAVVALGALAWLGRRPLALAIVAIGIVGSFAAWIDRENRRRSDYLAGASGVVVDSKGRPVEGAVARIHFEDAVFDAITPVVDASTVTGAAGEFGFTYISCGGPGGRYELAVEKPGYRTFVVHGERHGNHRVVLDDLGSSVSGVATQPPVEPSLGPAASDQRPVSTSALAAATAEPVRVGGDIPLPEPLDSKLDLAAIGRLLDSNRYDWAACYFELAVSKYGNVEGFRWLKPEQAAPEARAVIEEIARAWRFKPVLQDGTPIAVYFVLTIDHCPCLARPQLGG